ncbi:MAG: ATP-binding cassette domain-containing protein [Anaerolineae bacterium]
MAQPQRLADALQSTWNWSEWDSAKRQIGELSGGQQQRVFIARALAQEAELMLMDELLNGLDVKSQEDIFAILGGVALLPPGHHYHCDPWIRSGRRAF